jgi:hypothetical protein
MTADPHRTLDEREALALARVRGAASELKRAVVAAGARVARDYPWALPSAGLLVGIVAPFLIPDREPDPEDDCDGSRT